MRGEHHTHARDDLVELAIAEWKGLGVSFAPLQVCPSLFRVESTGCEQFGREVACHHVGTDQRSGNGCVARPSRNIEDPIASGDPGGCYQHRAEIGYHRRSYRRVVTQSPHASVLVLQGHPCLRILRGHAHCLLLCSFQYQSGGLRSVDVYSAGLPTRTVRPILASA
jgi:hypothetical protein